MEKLLLVGLLLGSFAFGQTIITKKGSYCTGITSIGGDHGSGAGEFFRFYKVCNINGKEYNDVALGYTWGRSDNVAPYKFFNKKLKANHKTYFNAGTKLNFEKNYTVEMRGTGYSKSSELGFENVGFFEKTVKNYFGFEAADYKKLPFTDEIK